MKKEDTVYYCSNCLSLSIKTIDGIDYCTKCGCAIINKDTTDKWEEATKEKYPKERVLHPRGIFVYNKINNEYYKK